MPRYSIAFRVVDFHSFEVDAKDFEEAKSKAQARVDAGEEPDRISDGKLTLDEEASAFC